MRKTTSFLFLALVLTSLVAGCKPASSPTATPVPAADTPTLPPTSTPVSTLTPAPATLTLPGDDWGYPSPFAFYSRGPGYIRMSLLFDTLTWKNEDGVIPWLADEWVVSDDGTEWTFTLHPDVAWHDGELLTAEDVAFTFEYFKAHQQAFKWAWPMDKVEGAEAIDERTVVLALTEPIAGCQEVLIGSLPIIPKRIWEDVDDPAKYTAEEAVVGSGPFKLVEYNKEEARYIYEANPDYFKGSPVVDTLTFIKVENQALALETGTIDYASFSGKEIEAVREFEDDPIYGIIEGPSFWVLQVIFNTAQPPFDDVELRRAIAHAINRQRIVEQVTHGGAIVASLGILSPFTDWHTPNLPLYEYDPAQAKAMLEEAGVTDLRLTLITTGDFAREAELVQADLEQVSIYVEVQTGDQSTIDGLLREGNFNLAINGHGGIANPAILLTPTWPAESYSNDEYDRLYQQQASTINEEVRRELVWQLQEIIAEDLPILTLWHPKMWTVYDASKLNTWFYTKGGVGFGIPISMNKLIFLQ
jgi:peptide/nickel transport system substrate-binding protein